MKKVIISLCLCLGLTTLAVAQDTTEETANPRLTKRGISYLPVAGDIAIGVDAAPFLQYLGNAFNSSFNNAPVFNGVDNTIYLKYFLQDDRALRAKFKFNVYQDKFKQTVANNHAIYVDPTNVDATTIDTRSVFTQDYTLSLGYELRRGHGRVQGFYGAEFILGYSGGNSVYEYGNEITSANQVPTFHNWGVTGLPTNTIRPTEYKNGNAISAGLGAFVGVEYFVAPQLSIGGELGLAYSYYNKSQDVITGEYFNNATGNVVEAQRRFKNANTTNFSTGLYTSTSGSIFLLFHF